MLEGGVTTQRDLDRLEELRDRNLVKFINRIEYFRWKEPTMII